jgi:hypothetical protein
MCPRRRRARAPPNRPRPRQTHDRTPSPPRAVAMLVDDDECAKNKSSASRRAASGVGAVCRRRRAAFGPGWLVYRDTFKHGPSATHPETTRQLNLARHLATRTPRARIVRRRPRVRRTFVSRPAVVESPSSSHVGAELARGRGDYSNIAARDRGRASGFSARARVGRGERE